MARVEIYEDAGYLLVAINDYGLALVVINMGDLDALLVVNTYKFPIDRLRELVPKLKNDEEAREVLGDALLVSRVI